MADEKTGTGVDTLSKEEFARLLQTTLPVNASREQLHEHIRGKDKVINYLFHHVAMHGNAIIDIREKMVEHKAAIEMIGDAVFDESDRPKLIGFEEPKIIVPRAN